MLVCLSPYEAQLEAFVKKAPDRAVALGQAIAALSPNNQIDRALLSACAARLIDEPRPSVRSRFESWAYRVASEFVRGRTQAQARVEQYAHRDPVFADNMRGWTRLRMKHPHPMQVAELEWLLNASESRQRRQRQQMASMGLAL